MSDRPRDQWLCAEGGEWGGPAAPRAAMLGWSGRRPALPLGPRERPMEPTVTLRVSYRGDTRSFLVSDPARTTWADVEAMVKVSFDLDNIQIKYIDEDNDEVSVNSKEEYEEALKIAVKQGNQLQMNAYEKNPACALQVPEKAVTEKLMLLKDEKKPLLCYSMLAQGLQEELKNDKELTIQQKLNQTQTGSTSEDPPEWFTNYLETFREQVVKETVEKLEQKLYEKLVHCNQPPDFAEGSVAAAPPPPEGPGSPCDWLISCCNCQARIIGVRYQCSLCPAYNICEECEAGTYAHDPNHVLLKLRRPVLCVAENYSPTELPPRLPATLEQVRLQKQMDKRFLKAEKQRLRAEKKQRKAEVRELKKQLKLHRKIHLWNSVPVLETSSSPTLKSESLQPNTFLSPNQPLQTIVPTLSAVFVDENLPDGTHLQPGTKFIKHWRMKNTGNVEWSSDTKLKLMWGNLTLASSEKKDVLVPSLSSGQVGTVSVEFVAPNIEGTYTSHWRLSHRGEQFGPRIWCSIVVDPSPAAEYLESDWKDSDSCQKSNSSSTKQDTSLKTEAGAQLMGETTEQAEISLPLKIKNLPSEREFYIPSVDLLTAQDLLSFELLDINIVQELERVPHNTPVDMTPCMSPLPHDSPLLEKPGLGQIEEENEGSGFKLVPGVAEDCLPVGSSTVKVKAEHALNQEEGEEDMSGTQFVCETVIRSLTLDAAPDHKPPQKKNKILQNSLQTLQDSFTCNMINEESPLINTNSISKKEAKIRQSELMTENYYGKEGDLPLSAESMSLCSGTDNCDEEEDKDDVQSQGSSASSEDYIIILPECFDTSRPLGESMYSSALSQPSLEKAGELETGAESPEEGSQPQVRGISDILSTSQTPSAVPLTPETADTSPPTQRNLAPLQDHTFQELNTSTSENISSAPHNQIPREEPSGEDSHGPGSSELPPSKQKFSEYPRYPQGSSIAGELVKGALSVAASAYKALFAGPPIIEQQPAAAEEQTATLLSSLCEMGFCDVQLNLRLLKKHNNNMIQVVTELLQISNSDWYSGRC